MKNAKDDQDTIESLTRRIESLELDNKRLKAQVSRIQARNESVESNDTPSDEYERAKKEIYLDRHQRRIDLGDTVYILTPGAHTSRSRRGTVSGFDRHRNRVFILDECHVTQERAPKNLRIEKARSDS